MNTLIYTMGEKADDIFHSFDLSDEDKKKYKTVKNKFDSHFVRERILSMSVPCLIGANRKKVKV